MERLNRIPIVSLTLVVVNLIVYVICTFTGDWLYALGELSLPRIVLEKEYGRIIWAMFLHAGDAHIFNNMLILFFLGAMIEKEIGHIRYAFAYFFSGIVGNLVSCLAKYLTKDFVPSVGASGAVFGLFGVMLALVLFSGRKMPNVTPLRVGFTLLYLLYSGFSEANIDNAAHVGGLIAGFLFGMICCVIERIRTNRELGGEHFAD